MIIYRIAHSNGEKEIAGHIVFREYESKGIYEETLMSSHGYTIKLSELKDTIKKDEFILKHF